MKRILYIILGCIGVGLGAVGAVVPMLPAFQIFFIQPGASEPVMELL